MLSRIVLCWLWLSNQSILWVTYDFEQVFKDMKIIKRIFYPFECLVCDSFFGSNKNLKDNPKLRMNCPYCGAYPRHRFLWLYLREHTDLFSGSPKRVLHVSPYTALKRKFKKQKNLDYVTSSPDQKEEDLILDLINTHQSENSFDVVLCSHVLEHIQDDQKAISEIYRILKPGGFALFMFPVKGKVTYEDVSMVSPEDRKKYFLQEDHVRVYGEDVLFRFEKAGFEVSCVQPRECFSEAQIQKYNLFKTQRIYRCKKMNNL